MLKYCRKCNEYSDDPLLRFCLNDGSPLVEINESNQIWSEGQNFIYQVKQKTIRENRKKRLARIIKNAILLVLMIMIITTLILRSWVYINKPIEIIPEKAIDSEKQPEIPTTAAGEIGTPSPTPKLEIKPSVKPSVTITPLTDRSPVDTPQTTKKTDICNEVETVKAKKFIENDLKDYFYKSILNVEQNNAIRFFKNKYPFLVQREFTAYPDLNISAVVSNCSRGDVKVEFSFYPSIRTDMRVEDYKGTMNFVCTGSKNNWKCQ